MRAWVLGQLSRVRGALGGRRDEVRIRLLKSIGASAAILSVVESCRRIGVSVKEYLADVLPGMERRPLSQVATLTPARWSAARG